MLNKGGITKVKATSPSQILANVSLQSSVGCIVKQAVGVKVGNLTIAKAGTPIRVDLMNLQTPAEKANASVAMNAVLLHDVDVTNGNANGTALVFGFVNVNRVDTDVAAAISTASGNASASKLITFMKA